MKIVTAKSIASACEVSVEDVNREIKALWQAGNFDKKIFYSGLAQTAAFALAFGILFGLVNRCLQMPVYVSYIGLGLVIFVGFRAAIYAALERSIKARLGKPGNRSEA